MDRLAPPLGQKKWDPYLGCLLLAVVGHYGLMASLLVVPNPELSYPFLDGDSYDWLANALALAGEDVRYSGRPPFLPLLLAGLDRLGAMGYFPLIVQGIVHLVPWVLYLYLRGRYPRHVAWVVAVACGFGFSWRRFSVGLMADALAASLLTLAVFLWLRARDRPELYPWSGLIAGLSAVTQQTALLLPIPAVASLLWPRRALFSRWIAGAGLLFLLPTMVWTGIKWTLFETPGDVLVSHWTVLSPHLDTLDDYLIGIVSFLGLPAALGVGVGVVLWIRRLWLGNESGGAWIVFLLAYASMVLGFFGVAYDHTSKRFLCYLMPFFASALAECLARVRGKALFAAVAMAVLGVSLLPLPAAEGFGRSALWAFPPTYLQVPQVGHRRGGAAVEIDRARVERRDVGEAVAWGLIPRLLDHRSRRPERPLIDREVVGDDRAVIFLHDPSQIDQRVDSAFRLGVELRKRVHFLPFSAFSASFFEDRMGLRFLARNGRTALYRADVSGLGETWLLAADADGSVDRALAGYVALRSQPIGPLPALSAARRLAGLIGSRQPAVFLDPKGRDDWRLYLPFVLPSAELTFIEPAQAASVRSALDELDRTVDRGSGVVLIRVDFLGQPWVILETAD